MHARGIDLSRYNHPTRQNLADWRELGFAIGFYNVGIGLDLDPLAAQHRGNLLAAGYLTAPYQALHEHERWRPEDQALLLVSKRTAAEIPLLMADWERPALTGAMIRAFYAELRRLTTDTLWAYTNASRWYGYFPTPASRAWVLDENVGLMVAGYPYDRSDYRPDGTWQGQLMDPASVALRSTPPATVRPTIPMPWAREDAWQHTGHGRLPGYDRDLDLQVYPVTAAELRARFGAAPVPEPVPDQTAAAIAAQADAISMAAADMKGLL